MAKPGFGNIMKQAQQMQERMQKIQEELLEKRVEGNSGGGMVTAIANGKGDLVQLKIDPEVVDKDDVEMLEDLVVAAVNQAAKKAQEMSEAEMSKMAGGMLPNLPGGLNPFGM
ncbi:MAG: YbaB/EbfC family nucleoid-associated protein [Calditrichaeota bacterium]|nr:MAG: YbaB/EbfC family nucleoid-associated protein [Calditrichota bacterium]